jgi:hypothetical protein
MAAYHKVEVSLNTNAVEVGVPSPQTVNVVVPTIGPAGPTGSVGPVGPTGPQGVPGTGLEVLTTQGDILYQGASTGQRLAIGTSGQVLKVANGIPAWGNESGAVTSVNGQTGAVTVAVPSASSTTPAALGTAAVGSASTFARADHVHAAYEIKTASFTAQVGGRYAIYNTNGVTVSDPSGGYNDTYEVLVIVGPATVGNVQYAASTVPIIRRGIGYMNSWETIGRTPFLPSPPTFKTSDGSAGQMAYDGTYFYICVSTNTWRRVPVAAW